MGRIEAGASSALPEYLTGSASSTDLLRAILDGLPAMVGYWDRDLRNRMANSAYLEWFGRRPEEMLGTHIRDLLGPKLFAENSPYMERALQGEGQTFDRTLVDVDGTTRHTQASYIPDVRDDEVVGFFVLVTEITARVEAERRGATIAQAVTAVAKISADTQTVRDVASRVTEVLQDIFGLDDVTLLRLREPGRAEVLAARSPRHEPGEELAIEEGTAAALALGTGRPALQRYEPQSTGLGGRLHAMGLRVGAAAPISVRGEVWGALVLASSDPSAIDGALVDLLGSVSELVGLAIGNAEAWEALRREATTDPLTGLPNRRAYRDELDRCLAQSARSGTSVGLILLDIDHFKAINDNHGHPVGDAVLRDVGHRLAAVARSHELAARVGGEEFALVVTGVDDDVVMAVAERARRVIVDTPFPEVGTVTASAGVAVVRAPRQQGARDHLAAAADRALYAAKRTGRNRVVGPGGRHISG
ncbi:MAG: diguanylate cyclase [Solirubrobacteraceae bacterium]|nr:diguanylate cyclase [Solirubrobacteraceae bacterium]